jgi:zinc transporter ZupT
MRWSDALELLLWSVLAALAAGLGPFFIGRKYLGWANAFAAGMMLGAGYLVMETGLNRAPVLASTGAALGIAATFVVHWLLGLGSRPVTAYAASAVHSAPEGVAMGAAMALSPVFGGFVVLTLALHNISESAVVVSNLELHGYKTGRATVLAVGARVTQVLLAFVAFVIATTSAAALSLTLGFAFGALVYLCVAELLPDAYHTAGRTSIAVVATVAAGVVSLLGAGLR